MIRAALPPSLPPLRVKRVGEGWGGVLLLLALALLLAACGAGSATDANPTPPAPAPASSPPAEPAPVSGGVLHLLDAIPPAPSPDSVPICDQAVDLIIGFEVGSPSVYTRKYQHPIWPGAASGVTVGIGYDLGYRTAPVILQDWHTEPHRARLASVAGITGPIARNELHRLADIAIQYDAARTVFDQTSVVEHYRIARRVFRPDAFDQLLPCTRGALVSVVFNRGGSMVGERRREMRAIRDDCLPTADTHCIATQLRAMSRIWRGSTIERGMTRRRNAEADLALASP